MGEQSWRERMEAKYGEEAREYLATCGTGEPYPTAPATPCPRWSLEETHPAHDWDAPVDGRSECPGWAAPVTAEDLNAASNVQVDARKPESAVPAGDLRERLTVAIEAWFNLPDDLAHNDEMACQVAEVVLAVLRQDTGDPRARMVEAAKRAFAGRPPMADGVYALDSGRNPWTALKDALDAALSVRWEHAAHLAARATDAERRAEHADGELSSRRGHEIRWGLEKVRADKAEAERDEHWKLAMSNGDVIVQERNRADRAEAQVAALQRELAEIAESGNKARAALLGEHRETVRILRERAEQAERELAEASAANGRVRRLCEMTIATSCRAGAIAQAEDTLAAMDAPPRPEDTRPVCKCPPGVCACHHHPEDAREETERG